MEPTPYIIALLTYYALIDPVMLSSWFSSSPNVAGLICGKPSRQRYFFLFSSDKSYCAIVLSELIRRAYLMSSGDVFDYIMFGSCRILVREANEARLGANKLSLVSY